MVQALKLLAASRVGPLLQAVVQANADLHIGGCADLLARASAVAAWRGELQGAAQALLDAMPGDPARPKVQADAWRRERADAAVVHDSLRALAAIDAGLADAAASHWLAWPKTYGLDNVIVPALRRLASGRHCCTTRPLSACERQRWRISWRARRWTWRRRPTGSVMRKMNCRCEHCQSLSRFLQSASQEVWRFKAREADRRHVEDSIRQGRHDVDCTSESARTAPDALVCSKNQASYERRVAQRRVDLDDLQRLGA